MKQETTGHRYQSTTKQPVIIEIMQLMNTSSPAYYHLLTIEERFPGYNAKENNPVRFNNGLKSIFIVVTNIIHQHYLHLHFTSSVIFVIFSLILYCSI